MATKSLRTAAPAHQVKAAATGLAIEGIGRSEARAVAERHQHRKQREETHEIGVAKRQALGVSWPAQAIVRDGLAKQSKVQ